MILRTKVKTNEKSADYPEYYQIYRQESAIMVDEGQTRLRNNISHAEFERRWKAVRQMMEDQKLDFLIMQNCSDFLAGYVRYFTDLPSTIYPVTLIFPRGGEITSILHGPTPPAPPNPPLWTAHGIKRRISIPLCPTFHYTRTFDAEKVVEELAPFGNCRIGLVGTRFLSATFYQYITQNLGRAVFVDATDLVDNIIMVKSEEEIRLTRETCAAQDAAIEYALTRIWPGRKEFEIYAEVMQKLFELGSSQANVMVGSAPAGYPAKHMLQLYTNRMIEKGDQFSLLIEANGRSGLFGEIFRHFCLGKIPSELQEQFEVAQQAQKITLKLLKPGTSTGDIWDAHNEFLRKSGYMEETRVFAHGQGYNSIERPSIDHGETTRITANMNIAVHPAVMSPNAYAQVCENYIVTETGDPICLSKSPQKIYVI
jgi:Xaa-Pro aminopeptidase